MGKQKIVISERDNIAVLFEDDVAVEFIIHRGDVLLGDVYLAQVENILPSIDAAFVNVGTERMGFLHSSDVQGKGDLKNRLQPKQNIVVQVMKEPTGHKGPRVTTNLALPGRFLVLMPESKGISISRKIAETKERSRLKSTVSLMKPPGVGVIIRTEAENQSEPEIQEDFETLIERWQNIVAMADTAKPPTLLYRDQDLLYRVIREMVTEDVKEIVVDTQFGQQRANQLLQNWGIEHPVKVTLYSGQQSIMIGAGIDKEIKLALQTKVPLPSGGYLYIQPTEALTVIDVNSGKFTSLQSQAETIRLTNLEASKEIARQLRLRNIGGMIIVDFIDMESRANQLSVLESFEMELSADKAKPQIGQLSDLGLVEMTRHRQGQSLSEIFTKKCITCGGTGLTLDDLNWMPTDVGRGAGRHKLPIRQQRGGQQQQKEALPKPGAQTLRKLIDPRATEPLREGFLQRSKEVAEKEEKAATESMTPEELYKHRLVKKLGIRLANIVKLARLPLGINSIVVRINPKASDVFTLVDAIEGAGFMGEMDTEFEEIVEGEVIEQAPEIDYQQPPRHQRHDRHDRHDRRDRGERPPRPDMEPVPFDVESDIETEDEPELVPVGPAVRRRELDVDDMDAREGLAADYDRVDEFDAEPVTEEDDDEAAPALPAPNLMVQQRLGFDSEEYDTEDEDEDTDDSDEDESPSEEETEATAPRRRGRPSAKAKPSDDKPRRGRPKKTSK